jgi:hypothetical protein
MKVKGVIWEEEENHSEKEKARTMNKYVVCMHESISVRPAIV